MTSTEAERKEKPFGGKKIYFCGPIVVANPVDSIFNWQIVQFIQAGGGQILDEHVGGRDLADVERIFERKWGRTEEDPQFVRKVDIEAIDNADYMIAIVSKPSLGIGMEIQRALDKPGMGLNHTPILCLKADDGSRLSKMVTGISPAENRDFVLATFKSVGEAQEIITEFLLRH